MLIINSELEKQYLCIFWNHASSQF